MEDQRINRESEVYDRTVDCALVRRCLQEQEDLSGRIHGWCADDDWVTYLLLRNHHQVPIMFRHNHFFIMHGLSGSRVLQLISFAQLVSLDEYLHCTVCLATRAPWLGNCDWHPPCLRNWLRDRRAFTVVASDPSIYNHVGGDCPSMINRWIGLNWTTIIPIHLFLLVNPWLRCGRWFAIKNQLKRSLAEQLNIERSFDPLLCNSVTASTSAEAGGDMYISCTSTVWLHWWRSLEVDEQRSQIGWHRKN